MKIYISHAKSAAFQANLYEPLRNSVLSKDHTFIFPHDSDKRIDSRKLFEKKECDLIIAEVSEPSTGQGIELGFAKILEIPIVCIYKKGSKIANSLKAVTSGFIEYSDPKSMIEKLTQYLNDK